MSGRVLIAVTHLLGIGHLVRAAHLARALALAGYAVTLVSGGASRRAGGEEPFRFEPLLPVRVEGTDFRNLLAAEGKPATTEQLAARRERLAELAREIAPDLLITEHFPFGRRQLAAEFLGLIAAARQANPAVLVLSSIRDVLVAPQRADRLAEVSQRVAELFDGVLVHGDPAFLPLEASWPVTPEIAAKLHYTGYLVEVAALESPPMDCGAAPLSGHVRNDGGKGAEILVSGGGSAAALPLFALAVAAARLLPGWPWRILVGHGVAEADFAALRHDAPANAVVERVRPDFPALLAECAVSISQAGYNTVLDLIRAGRPALCVPFDAGNETEQAIRAEALERAGLARVLRLGEPGFDAAMLAQAVESALDLPFPATGGGRKWPASRLAVDLDGASRSVAIVARLLAGRE